MPMWGWVLLAILGLPILAVRLFYGRFRAMCAGVRRELAELVGKEYPELRVVREQQGNLILSRETGPEIVWELADVYTEVARLPGMGRDSGARARIYRKSLDALLVPPVDAEHPLTLAAHGNRIKPMLLRPGAAADGAELQPLPSLGLQLAFVADLPAGRLPITTEDREALGLTPIELRTLALRNLGVGFPREVVTSALEGNATAFQGADGFDAARLLLIPDQLAEGEELTAIVPHRDLLVLLRANSPEELERAREGARAMDEHGHPPLLDEPVRITSAGLSLYAGVPTA
jgi:hypothetical protein